MSIASSTTLWYVSRGTGVVTLLLLTASVLLGIVTSYRWSSPAWPRFVVEFVHRNVSLLVVAFLAAHVVTVIGDSYAPIGWKDALIPFLSPYRRLWLGLGTVAADILLALVVTSLLRHRVGFKTWRIVHWFAYLCWPLAVVHGLGTGSDAKLGIVLVITAVCVLSVVVAGALRLVAALPAHTLARRAGLAASAFAPVVLVRVDGLRPARRGLGASRRNPRERVAPGVCAARGRGGPRNSRRGKRGFHDLDRRHPVGRVPGVRLGHVPPKLPPTPTGVSW